MGLNLPLSSDLYVSTSVLQQLAVHSFIFQVARDSLSRDGH